MKDRNSLNNIVKICSKIMGTQLTGLNTTWEKRVLQRARSITSNQEHVLASEFALMQSGRRYLPPIRWTNRYGRLFVPSAISLLNAGLV